MLILLVMFVICYCGLFLFYSAISYVNNRYLELRSRRPKDLTRMPAIAADRSRVHGCSRTSEQRVYDGIRQRRRILSVDGLATERC